MVRKRGTFRRALELSLLLHLLAVFLIAPRVAELWTASAPAATVVELPEPERPLTFEFVDLPDDREEAPPDDRPVPLSDRDRRAHGGEGEAAERPGVRGTTPQLVQSEGGLELRRGAPPQAPGTQPREVPPPEPDRRPPERERQEPAPVPEPEGAGEPQPEEQRPAVPLLPPPGAWSVPPDVGGLPESPDRRGGQVDTGGLSFDTQWYDWGPYAKKMLAKIRAHWRIPEIARLGVPGVVRIRFYIERDGRISGLAILDESGRPPMDFAARDAISGANPFDPLPSDLTGVDREGVTITFFYNVRPPERGF